MTRDPIPLLASPLKGEEQVGVSSGVSQQDGIDARKTETRQSYCASLHFTLPFKGRAGAGMGTHAAE